MSVDESICPCCEGVLKYYDSVLRIIRKRNGDKYYARVRRFKCIACGKLHRELPNHLLPYKHYDAQIIKDVRDGIITPDTLGYEDRPCEMTMTRWKES